METGIIPNIDRFGVLISSCQGYGTRFNPANNKIKLPALQTVQTNALQSIQDINAQSAPRDTVINTRFLLFQQLPLYVTRVISALIASENVEKVTIADAMVWVRKIRGERKNKKILSPSPENPKQISASQHSYGNQVEFFDEFITFILYQSVYHPNETELLEPALRAFETQLRDANKECVDVNTPWLNALIARDVILYAPVTGLVDRALATKKYVKSVNAISADEYAQIASLKFTRPRKKK